MFFFICVIGVMHIRVGIVCVMYVYDVYVYDIYVYVCDACICRRACYVYLLVWRGATRLGVHVCGAMRLTPCLSSAALHFYLLDTRSLTTPEVCSWIQLGCLANGLQGSFYSSPPTLGRQENATVSSFPHWFQEWKLRPQCSCISHFVISPKPLSEVFFFFLIFYIF